MNRPRSHTSVLDLSFLLTDEKRTLEDILFCRFARRVLGFHGAFSSAPSYPEKGQFFWD